MSAGPERRTDEAFRKFWACYPRKTGKLGAQKAFTKALKLATVDEIVAGVERYILRKPDYADYCHPETFLNKGRWMDEDDAPRTTWTPCDHTPPCGNPSWCMVVRARERGEVV